MRGRLNLFQSSMLRWRELHPYCASHVIQIEAPFDDARARAAIAHVIESCGLTGLNLDAARRRFEYEGGPATPALRVVDGAGKAMDVAAAEIESTINEPFAPTGRFDPFRFFAIRSDGTFLLGVTYDHFIAGGDSIAVLLTDVADRYLAGDAPALGMLERYPPTYARLFAHQFVPLLRGLRSLPGLLAAWRRAIRPHVPEPGNGRNGFTHFAVDPAGLARLRASAQRWDVSQNDLWLALVLRAVAPLASQRHHTGRRTEVALASIVNVRADFQPAATEVFGQFLSSFRVVHPLPQGESIQTLARALSMQTMRAKRCKLYLVTLLAMAAATLVWPFATPERRHRLYLKYHPVFAGITPLNVNALRRQPRPGGVDYLRAASTGPMSPMVIAVTTAGASLRVGITYRTTALSPKDVATVVQAILEGMKTL